VSLSRAVKEPVSLRRTTSGRVDFIHLAPLIPLFHCANIDYITGSEHLVSKPSSPSLEYASTVLAVGQTRRNLLESTWWTEAEVGMFNCLPIDIHDLPIIV
jgi:hypothetical protein